MLLHGFAMFAGVRMLMLLALWQLYSNNACAQSATHWESKLYDNLMSTYNKDIRPVRTPDQQLTVTIGFSLSRIESLNEKDQVLTVVGWMTVSWKDETLQWNPLSYGGLARMVISDNKIWTPDITMLNSVDGGGELVAQGNTKVNVNFNGIILWVPRLKWRTTCIVNLKYLPFDTQICEVQFINWVYTSTLLNLTHGNEEVVLGYYSPNGEWDLVSTRVCRIDAVGYINGQPLTLPVVALQLAMKRKPLFLVLNLILPAIIMSFLSLLIFCLPPAAGEKISLGITVLLSFFVMLLMMSDITPRTSESIPVMSVFIIISMVLAALALCSTVLVLIVYHKPGDKQVPRWVRTHLLGWVSRVICIPTTLTRANTADELKIEDIQKDDRAVGVDQFVKRQGSAAEGHYDLNARSASWEDVVKVLDRLLLITNGTLLSVTIVVVLCVASAHDDDVSADPRVVCL